jgi:hypothetical protein
LILNEISFRDLYLDGNELRCQGLMDMLKVISEECENEAIKMEVAEKEKIEEEIKRLTEGKNIKLYVILKIKSN